MGAVIAAYLPSLLAGVARRGGARGWQFQLAIESLQQLHLAAQTGARGLTLSQLAKRLRVDSLQLAPSLDALVQLDWAGQLEELPPVAESRYVLLANPDATLLAPLMKLLVLEQVPATQNLWDNARWSAILLRDALPKKP